MSKQIEASQATRRANAYGKILAVFDDMPSRFKSCDLYIQAGILDKMWNRVLVSSILTQDFKCQVIGIGSMRMWKKPVGAA